MSAWSQDDLSEQIPVIHCELAPFPQLPFLCFVVFTGLIVVLTYCFTALADMLLLWVNNTNTKEGVLTLLAAPKDRRVMELAFSVHEEKTESLQPTNVSLKTI